MMFNRIYRYPVGEIIDLVIDNLGKEWDYSDKQFWGDLGDLIRRQMLAKMI